MPKTSNALAMVLGFSSEGFDELRSDPDRLRETMMQSQGRIQVLRTAAQALDHGARPDMVAASIGLSVLELDDVLAEFGDIAEELDEMSTCEDPRLEAIIQKLIRDAIEGGQSLDDIDVGALTARAEIMYAHVSEDGADGA